MKCSIMCFETYLNSLTADVDARKLAKLQSKFEPLWTEFSDVQLQIDMLEEVGEDDELYDERDKFETQYIKLISRAEKLLQNSTISSSTNSSSSNNISTWSNPLHLPEVKLPKFAGFYQYTILQYFYLFNSANQDINKIQKLHLKASKILVSMEMSEKNYENTWELLNDRYDIKRLIITQHIIQVIFDLPVMTKKNHTILHQIRDSLIKHIWLLKSLSCTVDYWDDL